MYKKTKEDLREELKIAETLYDNLGDWSDNRDPNWVKNKIAAFNSCDIIRRELYDLHSPRRMA